jgi:choline dehydrogenase-like flavoprotein
MRDVIVVGAGGGGPVVAKELAGRGLDVLLLEAGPRHADPRRTCAHVDDVADDPSPCLWQLSGVGGTTQHYFGNSPRAYPGVFADYNGIDAGAYDVAHRFPFDYPDLIPYYAWVEATLPVQTAAGGTRESVFFRGAETLGIPVQKAKTTTRDSYRPQENAILRSGHRSPGRRAPAGTPRNQLPNRSTDNSYVPMALTADVWAASSGGRPVTLITGAFVTQVHVEPRYGELTAFGVSWRDDATGDRHREDAVVVVLAGGCTETPRLWLNSGLPNPNGWVGRGYTDHFLDLVVGRFDERTGNAERVGSSARCDFPGRGSLENVGSIGPELVDTLRDRLGGEPDEWLNVLVITDDDVEARNRVTLPARPAGAQGTASRVRFPPQQRSTRTLANRELLVGKAVELLRGAGAREVLRIDGAPLILQVQSSMRMGTSDDDSVLDESAEARWVKRLFVADNSALANGLGGPNPTLTTQALATRTAERIFRRYFGGPPWVGQEAPVVSTDQRISDRLAELGV